MWDYLRRVDIISEEATIYGNQNSKRLQNTFGGLISLTSLLIILSAIIYFVYQFFSFSKPFVVMSTSYNDNITFVDYGSIPFMIRLSDEFQIPYNNSAQLYLPSFYWINTTVVNNQLVQQYFNYPMEHCDIEKHFGQYKDFINSNVMNIGSYFCINSENDKLNMTALYGGTKQYSFAYYVIRQCNTRAINNTCLPQSQIDTIFKNYYVDVIMLDYYIDKSITPNQLSLHTYRDVVVNNAKK